MVMILALLTFAVLGCVSALHAYWAFGGRWPAHDDVSLARTVVGTTEMPSRSLTLTVAVLILLTGLLPLATVALGPNVLPPALAQTALISLAAGFGLRGLAPCIPIWRYMHFEEPFATLDRRYFGPLCLLLCMAFAGLAVLN